MPSPAPTDSPPEDLPSPAAVRLAQREKSNAIRVAIISRNRSRAAKLIQKAIRLKWDRAAEANVAVDDVVASVMVAPGAPTTPQPTVADLMPAARQ